MSKELGKALKELRNRSGLTQKQVAEILHIDRSTYAYYEGGTTEPDLNSINQLAKLFGIDISALLPDSQGKINLTLRDVASPVTSPFAKMAKDEEDENISITSLSKDERGLVAWYRTLSMKQKEAIKDVEKIEE